MICVAVAERTLEGCLRGIAGAELAEIRLDHGALTPEEIRQLFGQKVPLIATCRPGILSDGERARQLLAAIDAGAAYVDVEIEAALSLRAEVLARARERGCKVIVSFHDYERTPSRSELDAIVEQCAAAGADVVKVAATVHVPADAARLLGLLDCDRPMVVAGMGSAGRIVRLAAPLLGSLFTFAAAEQGRETAPGQMTRSEMERMYQLLGARP